MIRDCGNFHAWNIAAADIHRVGRPHIPDADYADFYGIHALLLLMLRRIGPERIRDTR
jgi:hypothetical protein